MNSLHPRSSALRPTAGLRTEASNRFARGGVALLTGVVIVLAVGDSLRPHVLAAPDFVFPTLFGACLAGCVGADRWCNRTSDDEGANGNALIRRSSRLVYCWLYLLFGVNVLAAWVSECSIESAAGRLSRFVVAGIVILVMIRVSRFAPGTLQREGRSARS